ncbi:MAG TPA: hypothetical protein VFI72_07075 [Candidatus Angelobacter sp.]|nr:hypothetical protein [Candidatus Angelobacter sp.]
MNDPGTLSGDLKSLSAALKRTDQQLQSGPAPDAALLNEFRQAVDNVRLTAWSVSEAINSRRSGNEPDTVLAFLSAERLRRLDQLVRNLCGDIDRGAITAQNYGLNSLSDSVNVLQQKLAQCLAEQRRGEKKR